MNTGSSLANKVVILLLTLILAALGVVIYQNSRREAAVVPARTTEVAGEAAVPVEGAEVPAERSVEVPPASVARPRVVTANRPVATVARQPVAVIPPPAAVEFDTPAQELGLQPAPVPVPGAPLIAGENDGGTSEGEIFGRILLSGTPPAEIPIQMDATCGRLQTGPVTTRHYVVSPEGALANVFVYIKRGLESVRFPTPTNTPLMDNVNCMFEPYVMGVQAGQTFQVRNSDPLLHNWHLTATINRERNFALPIKGQVNNVSLARPEVMTRVKCDVHPWMFAYIGVTSHPFYAVTDQNGIFKLPAGLPPGTYTLAAYHLKAGELTKEITIRTGEAQAVDFQFTVPTKVAATNR